MDALKKKEELISIIVPVYNAEAYLDECIKSVRLQTYKNIELILVDDGSTDGSAEICRKHVMEDSRVRIIRQKNKGVASARNAGIRNANGNYVMFVDADDWIEANAAEKMFLELGAADVVVTKGFWKNYGMKQELIEDKIMTGLYEEEDGTDYFLKEMLFSEGRYFNDTVASMCGKIFKLSVIKEFYEDLNENLHYEEDAVFVYTYYLHCRAIVVSDSVYYHYRMHEDSAVHSVYKEFLKDVNEIYLYLENLFIRHRCSENLTFQLQKWIKELVFYGINDKMGFKEEAKLPIYRVPYAELLKNKKVVLYGAGKIGKEYYRSLKKAKICICLWVDNSWEALLKAGYLVNPIEDIQTSDYDYVLIAVKEEKMQDSIRENLIGLGVPEDRILWNEPETILN